MSRSKSYAIALALLVSASVSTGCTRSDTTGPSAAPEVSFDEAQGGNN